MKPRVFIDSSAFIFAKKFPQSNSAKIIELLANNAIDATISAKVAAEVYRYFKKHGEKELADKYRHFILQACRIIEKPDIEEELEKWKNQIKNKDLEHIVTVKAMQLQTLIGFDRDFKPFKEYKTPKQFLKTLGIKTGKTEY